MNTPSIKPPTAHGPARSILLGLVILVAGIAVGASVTILVLGRPGDRPDQPPEVFAERMLRHLGRELNLTPQQRQRLDPLLQTHYRALREIRAEVRPRIVAQLEQLDEDIASVLDEQQDRIWQRQIQRLEEPFPALRERRRGGGRGRGAGLAPNERGPHGPREPLGPGHRRRSHPDTPQSDDSPPAEPARTPEFPEPPEDTADN